MPAASCCRAGSTAINAPKTREAGFGSGGAVPQSLIEPSAVGYSPTGKPAGLPPCRRNPKDFRRLVATRLCRGATAIDSRHQKLPMPSDQRVPWLHLMGELSAKPTEGENPCRRTCNYSIGTLSLLSSSRQVALTPSSSEEGEGYAVPWLPLMRELSAKPTEGEKLIDRCTYAVFLP